MTSKKEEDLIHPNERGNGPNKRMEGGDETDDISINNPDDRNKEKRKDEYRKDGAPDTNQ